MRKIIKDLFTAYVLIFSEPEIFMQLSFEMQPGLVLPILFWALTTTIWLGGSIFKSWLLHQLLIGPLIRYILFLYSGVFINAATATLVSRWLKGYGNYWISLRFFCYSSALSLVFLAGDLLYYAVRPISIRGSGIHPREDIIVILFIFFIYILVKNAYAILIKAGRNVFKLNTVKLLLIYIAVAIVSVLVKIAFTMKRHT
jgi:hypothetical protein